MSESNGSPLKAVDRLLEYYEAQRPPLAERLNRLDHRIHDLRRQREEIAAEMAPTPADTSPVASATQKVADADAAEVDATSMQSRGALPRQVEVVLQEAGRPLKVAEVTRRLKARGITTNSKHGLAFMVGSALARKAKESGAISKVGRGLYQYVGSPAITRGSGTEQGDSN